MTYHTKQHPNIRTHNITNSVTSGELITAVQTDDTLHIYIRRLIEPAELTTSHQHISYTLLTICKAKCHFCLHTPKNPPTYFTDSLAIRHQNNQYAYTLTNNQYSSKHQQPSPPWSSISLHIAYASTTPSTGNRLPSAQH
jgi:hypothetical protein